MTTAASLASSALVALHQRDPADFAVDYLRRMGLHAAPVLDDERRPVGVASVSDLSGARSGALVGEVAHRPVVSVPPDASLADVAGVCADTGLHHVVVVDGGRVTGLISVIDVLRALLGREATHPPVVQVFGGFTCHAADWRPLAWLTPATAEDAPASPGWLRIEEAGRVLRVSRSADVRAELRDFLADPPDRAVWASESGALQFTWAPYHDAGTGAA